MSKRSARLSLNRETVRVLSEENLAHAAGGILTLADNTCPLIFGAVSQLAGECISNQIACTRVTCLT